MPPATIRRFRMMLCGRSAGEILRVRVMVYVVVVMPGEVTVLYTLTDHAATPVTEGHNPNERTDGQTDR
ncbi:hypothetical protein KQX54_016618 [Cotesia glomerata]|uniref:Uncharacterized protein n=1 Tax=Cotesia glomerata TaxID=32391 RepID=A0AAV7HY26_COTGL|nr:hypothetical protein KQX54_016618 [Cotesia glomerata]